MQIIDYNTRLFKNIFPTYSDFKTWYQSSGLSDNSEDVPSLKTFTLIFNEYSCSHCCMSVDDFKGRFANELFTYYKEFEATTKAISDLMALTDKDIRISDRIINNTADIPETTSTTDAEEVDYISAQQKQISVKGNLQVKRELLSSKRAFTVKSFLNKFKHLFIKVISPSYTFVVEEPDGE